MVTLVLGVSIAAVGGHMSSQCGVKFPTKYWCVNPVHWLMYRCAWMPGKQLWHHHHRHHEVGGGGELQSSGEWREWTDECFRAPIVCSTLFSMGENETRLYKVVCGGAVCILAMTVKRAFTFLMVKTYQQTSLPGHFAHIWQSIYMILVTRRLLKMQWKKITLGHLRCSVYWPTYSSELDWNVSTPIWSRTR